jgi:hypothetical protein
MCITDEMQICIESICYNDEGLHDTELYQICHDICHQETLSKYQIAHIFFSDEEVHIFFKEHNIIVLMNLCKK